MGEADEIWNKPRVKIMTLSSWRTESHVATFLNCFRFSLDIEKTPVYNEVTDIDWRSRPMKTEDMLKVKFVLVCAVASELESGQSVGIPMERLLHGISIINRMIFQILHDFHEVPISLCRNAFFAKVLIHGHFTESTMCSLHANCLHNVSFEWI